MKALAIRLFGVALIFALCKLLRLQFPGFNGFWFGVLAGALYVEFITWHEGRYK